MKYLLSVFTLILVTACGSSGAPSDAIIKSVIEKQIEDAFKLTAFMGKKTADDLKTVVTKFTNYGCVPHKAMKAAFTCDIEITTSSKVMGEKTQRDMLSLAKKADSTEWQPVP